MPITEGTTDFPQDNAGRHARGVLGPDGNFYHNRGAKLFVPVAPTINAGAYSAGMVIGGELTLTGAVPTNMMGATLEDIIVQDAADQKAGLLFLFFNANPAGTYTDHAAPTFVTADLTTNFLGSWPVNASDYNSIGGGRAVATVTPFLPLKPAAGSDLWCVILIPTATPTYGSTSALYVKFGLS